MAITNKHLEVQIKKAQIADQIEDIFLEGHSKLNRVPDFVNCGSHQIAVAWKALVEKYFVNGFGIPKRKTLAEMETILGQWQIRYDQLTGKRPLL